MSKESNIYYNLNPEKEEERLGQSADNFHLLEYDFTIEYLERYLPVKGKILDVECGTGRYSRWLLSKGYQVDAVDLSSEYIRLAKEIIGDNPDFEAMVGDILDIPSGDDYYDAVVCTGGVLSHIKEEDREKPWKNCPVW